MPTNGERALTAPRGSALLVTHRSKTGCSRFKSPLRHQKVVKQPVEDSRVFGGGLEDEQAASRGAARRRLEEAYVATRSPTLKNCGVTTLTRVATLYRGGRMPSRRDAEYRRDGEVRACRRADACPSERRGVLCSAGPAGLGRSSVGFEDTYLGRLRGRIGSDLVLMPGAGVMVVDGDDRVLLLHRADDGTWCMPGGAAEEGSSFVATALAELAEETGLVVRPQDLVPFASISEPDVHVLTYPNGDVTHCFAIWFAARRWTGSLATDEESIDAGFFARDALPEPLLPPSALALELYDRFVESGQFQAR